MSIGLFAVAAFAAAAPGCLAQDVSRAACLTASDIQGFVESHSKIALISGASVTKITLLAKAQGPCTLWYATTTEVGSSPTQIATIANLASLSPSATVKKWTNNDAYSVTLRTSSGENELPTKTISGVGPN